MNVYVMEYFFVKWLNPIKSNNQLYRRRIIYKGFGEDFYLKDMDENIAGISELKRYIEAGERIMVVIPASHNGKINVNIINDKFQITYSAIPDKVKIGETFELSDYSFIHKAVMKGLDVRIN